MTAIHATGGSGTSSIENAERPACARNRVAGRPEWLPNPSGIRDGSEFPDQTKGEKDHSRLANYTFIFIDR